MTRRILVLLVAVLAVGVGATACLPAVLLPNRPADPVVLRGAEVPRLTGVAPGDIVAFRYWGGTWQQVPVQVDERASVDLGRVYDAAPSGVVVNVYTDAGTWTGADPTPALDADDEVVFMARDLGGAAPAGSTPPGVIAGSGVQVRATDPLQANTAGYAYLFRRSGTLDPGAGKRYVDYSFSLDSGAYKTTYRLQDGPNPESTTVTGAWYTRNFTDRWSSDTIRITAPDASAVDILDANKAMFGAGNCVRTEATFNDAEGAFIANTNGPVRAIRSYIGANSGPWTQRDHVFYDRREDVTTHLRVHDIPAILDTLDYGPDAIGMRYRNNLNPTGVTIDGTPDVVNAGTLTWESVDGAQGTLVMSHGYETNLTNTPTSYYLDDTTPPVTQCTGDAFALGMSGPNLNSTVACTDPQRGCVGYLRTLRRLVYGAPQTTFPTNPATVAEQAATPLAFTVTNW
jgi:hypothetical protein